MIPKVTSQPIICHRNSYLYVATAIVCNALWLASYLFMSYIAIASYG